MGRLLDHEGMVPQGRVVSVQRRTYAGSPYVHASQGARGTQSPRQAADSRRSKGLPRDHPTARRHPLEGLRKDGRVRQPRHLRSLRQRSPHSAVQCSHQAHLRWRMHRCPAPAEGCRSPVRYRSLHYTRLAEARGENYGRVPWVVDSAAMSGTEITVRRVLPISWRDMGPSLCERPAAGRGREGVSVRSYAVYDLHV